MSGITLRDQLMLRAIGLQGMALQAREPAPIVQPGLFRARLIHREKRCQCGRVISGNKDSCMACKDAHTTID